MDEVVWYEMDAIWETNITLYGLVITYRPSVDLLGGAVAVLILYKYKPRNDQWSQFPARDGQLSLEHPQRKQKEIAAPSVMPSTW
jgi:hypothetical protein